MSKRAKLISFMIFNIIFALIALAILALSIWALFKLDHFDKYVLILLIFKLVVLIICILAAFLKNKPKFIIFYLILLAIFFAIKVAFLFLIIFVNDVKQYIFDILNKLINIIEDDKDEATIVVSIITGCDIAICIVSFILCLIYYKSSDDGGIEELSLTKGLDQYLKSKNSYTKKDESFNNTFQTY